MHKTPPWISLVVLISLLTVGCSSLFKGKEATLSKDVFQDLEKEHTRLSSQDRTGRTPTSIPSALNTAVKKWLTYFTGPGKEEFTEALKRGQPYLPHFIRILRKNKIPDDLVYVSLIESYFKPHAHSSAGASGMWQFMRGTGREYGLQINSYIDERRDPFKSTQAAANHLKGLYSLFGSWYLALAAYNGGHNRLQRVMTKHDTENFWTLAKRNALPRETLNYVPKFMAALLIIKHPEKFGFNFSRIQNIPALSLASIRVPGRVRLTELAHKAGVDLSELKKYNPQYTSSITPPKGTWLLRLPHPHIAKLANQMRSLKRVSTRTIASAQRIHHYRVRRGDSLSRIANHFKVSVASLKQANRMRNPRIQVGKILRIPGGNFEEIRTRSSSVKHPSHTKKLSHHLVRPGDSLSEIASHYQTSIQEIKRLNRLSSSQIHIGQRLKVPAHALKFVKVRTGDTLSDISARHNVRIRIIKRLNNLRNARIYAGQTLRLPTGT